MKVVLTLKRLREYYENNAFLARWLDTTTKNKADFKDLLPDIDHWLSFWYEDELVKTERNDTVFPYYVVSWWNLRVEDFNKVYAAMLQEYDALADYWMKEHSGDAHDIADYESKSENGGNILQTYAKRTNTDYTSTNEDATDANKFDSKSVTEVGEGSINADETTDNRSVTTTNKYKSHDKSVTIGDNTLTGADVNEHYIDREGNRGDRPMQEMLEAELKLRKNSFIRFFAEAFENDCLTGLFDYDF